ncbi:hypothetical protein IQ07DRAFT_506810 [Pyrenochaeta sp. DS3sAY3a]|nr:hypothetical protein IQ07DRAFT_506810 [Pyrenochaeta sp. DS3sAY3a]
MNHHRPPASSPAPAAPDAPHQLLQQHRRQSSRTASLLSSASSVVTIQRSASFSLRDSTTLPDPSRPTPPLSTRRRSSAATGTAEGIAAFRDGAANINRWSQSTASSSRSSTLQNQHKTHAAHPSFSRKLSISTAAPLATLASAFNGPAPLPQSPSRSKNSYNSSRPRSPVYAPASSVTQPPSLPLLPPILLPSTVYDPNTPTSASTTNSPSTGLYTPATTAANPSRDYFNSKPVNPLSASQRPPSRSKVEKVFGKSPLASPAVLGLHDDPSSATARPTTGRRASIVGTRDTSQKPPQSAGQRRAASRDHSRSESRDHNRSESRDHNRSSSRDHFRSESNTSARLDDSYLGTPPRNRERREKDKKTMLSRALQKANTAVLLDNAQNFEGATEAYEDACKLLQQVMIRSSQEEDRRKLDAIQRVTYTNRIEELRRLDPGYSNHSGKSLPARPMSGESLDEQRSMLLMDDDEPAIIQTATMTRIVNDRPIDDESYAVNSDLPAMSYQLPLRKPEFGTARESVISTAIRDVQRGMQTPQFHLQPPPGRLVNPVSPLPTPLESPMDRIYMPPPLSPKRSRSPLFSGKQDPESDVQNRLKTQHPTGPKHQRVHSDESTSWLDTIDESGGSSCSSSVRSLSPGGMRRKHNRNTGGTEAEFDAALDAAVEAAYDEGYEPYEDDDDDDITSADLIATRLRNVELAKEKVREAEREEAIAAAKYRYKETQLRNEKLPHVRESAELSFNDEADEEERLLDEMTREYMLDGFDFDLQTKSSLPRQSDSSGFSGSTYNSSVSSHRTTGGTSLSTVVEAIQSTSKPPPAHSPPPVPAPAVPQAPHTEKPPVPAKDSPAELPILPKSAAAATFATPVLNHGIPNESGLVPSSPRTGKTSAMGIRKNKSSLSLKARNLSISSPDGSDASIGTPLSTTFSLTGGRKPSNAGLTVPTPSIPTFNVEGLPSGGMHLFEHDIHSPFSPGSPSPAVANAPIPLEPCPDSYLLRPFWLMRAFYQTIAHPRGGYLSTKLFIPRDVWRVKGVKLKNVEDKIANCDLLTAALQKLASVDTFDADAILEEMQSLEVVLDQVQTQLTKKLGNEVGVHSVSALFKDATTVGEGAASTDGLGKGSHGSQDNSTKSAVAQGKSYLTSWRKLRSKNSGINLSSMAGSKNSDVAKDSLVMATLPMTSLPTIRFAKRDVTGVVFEGPNSGYMGSLARLFDAAQILDQIARQVEDPGLKYSSPTHVGLELSARHAAEFFGFYICRFVLTDVTMMLDKFIKRGSEWVLV